MLGPSWRDFAMIVSRIGSEMESKEPCVDLRITNSAVYPGFELLEGPSVDCWPNAWCRSHDG